LCYNTIQREALGWKLIVSNKMDDVS